MAASPSLRASRHSSTAVRFVAEVSSNHNGDPDRCLAFVDLAANVGCQAVKFQLFRVHQLFAPEILDRSPEHRTRVNWELPTEFLAPIAERCKDTGILLGFTPFDLDAVVQLTPFVDFFKIASYEILWQGLHRACAQTGKPIVLSTGMATLDEIEAAVEVLREEGCQDLTLLHCVSGYPAPASECNLAAIETLQSKFGCPVGWSDHSGNPGVIQRAVQRWGASMVEFHLDIEGEGAEFATGHCWLPGDIRRVITETMTGLEADGTGEKQPAPSEQSDRNWRADPADGLRPLTHVRAEWAGRARESE